MCIQTEDYSWFVHVFMSVLNKHTLLRHTHTNTHLRQSTFFLFELHLNCLPVSAYQDISLFMLKECAQVMVNRLED